MCTVSVYCIKHNYYTHYYVKPHFLINPFKIITIKLTLHLSLITGNCYALCRKYFTVKW